MFEQDYIMRMIHEMVAVVMAMLGKNIGKLYDEDTTEQVSVSGFSLRAELMRLINSGNINEAENLLHDELDFTNADHFLLATEFYNTLNELTDEQLEQSDFSREEILDGLKSCAEGFGMSSLLLDKFDV